MDRELTSFDEHARTFSQLFYHLGHINDATILTFLSPKSDVPIYYSVSMTKMGNAKS